jgi:undecaprenyl-phosphate galactose phosphotransferase
MDVLAATERQLEMRSRRAVREGWLLAAGDLLVILACFVAGRTMNYWFGGIPWHATWYDWPVHVGEIRPVIFVALGIACVVAFWRLGHYARRRPFWQEIGDVLGVVVTFAIVDAALVFLTKTNFSRLWWAASWSLVALLVPLARVALKHVLIGLGAWLRPTVVVGSGPNALDAARALDSEPLLGFEVVALVQPPDAPQPVPAYLEVGGKRLPVLRAAPYPDLLPAHLGRPHVVVALELDEIARCGGYVERLSLHYGDVDMVSPIRGLPLAGTQVTHFFSHDVLSLRLYNNLARPWPRRLKRAFDLIAGSLLGLFVAPLALVIGWQVRRSGRPVLYRHPRIGKGGRPFVCFKFRTMVPDAERVLAAHLAAHPEARAAWQRDHKLKDDPRITPFGAWLRRTSLDELPQLLNVLRGEMSLVGPRPVIAEELARYGDSMVYYVESTPGLTGLWQISGRNDLDYRRRVHLDCWYVKNWSLWYDLVILLKTPRAVLRGNGAY